MIVNSRSGLKLFLILLFSLQNGTFLFGNNPGDLVGSLIAEEKSRVLKLADQYWEELPLSVTAFTCERSAGTANDFYSEGDYWWPDPENPDGPYIRRDGMSNPENFSAHRHAMVRMNRIVGAMASAYLVTGDDKYVLKAMEHLQVWFLTQQTKMNPHMLYSQAIKGIATGRGIGIIDAIHLMEVARSIKVMESSPAIEGVKLYALKGWFGDFLTWITTHEYGKQEMVHPNNHGTCWAMQAAAYADLTGNYEVLDLCSDLYRSKLLPLQMAEDGSFPLELQRTKPYGYSLFNLDAMTTLVQILSLRGYHLWEFTAENGRSLKAGMDFLFPYLNDKDAWPYPKDVLYWDQYPVRQAFLVFGALEFNEKEYLDTWLKLEGDPTIDEVQRNMIIRYPLLWLGLDAPGKENTLLNPVLPGFHPDPSICRVGEDFYCVTSSFEYFPGVPVYHSKDLVNWEQIGHVLDRPSQLNLDSVGCSGGIFAPTIRYHEGIYYMITTLVSKGSGVPSGNFIVTAKDPAGPWSDPHFIEGAMGIDPSLFFDDDGKVYYQGNKHPPVLQWRSHRQIWIQEIDLKTFQLVGDLKVVLDAKDYHGRMGNYSLSAFEAPHLYKKDAMYYLSIANGGTGYQHCVSIFRSDNVFGPYDSHPDNPILTNSDFPEDYPIACTGHADFFDDSHGNWWLTLLATRPYGGGFYNLGRETFIVPVDWTGDWPRLADGSRRAEKHYVVPANHSIYPASEAPGRDEFNSKELGYQWNMIRTPRSDFWKITPKGKLVLKLLPQTMVRNENPSFIGRRQQHHDMEAFFKMEFKPRSENECAGMVLIRDTNYQLRYVLTKEGERQVLKLIKRSAHEGEELVLATKEVGSGELLLKVSTRGQEYSFFFAEKDGDWKTMYEKLDGRFLSRKWAGGFTGLFIGMYASSNGKPAKNVAEFDWFEYRKL